MTFARVWRRIAAFLLDYLFIAAYIALLIAISVGLGFSPLRNGFRAMFANPNSSELSAFLCYSWLRSFFTLRSASALRGKRPGVNGGWGCASSDTHGARLSLPRSLLRSLLKFVPWELTHACLWRIPGWPLAPTAPPPIITVGLALVWVIVAANLVSMLVSVKRQALYDWIAGTYVIALPYPIRTPASGITLE